MERVVEVEVEGEGKGKGRERGVSSDELEDLAALEADLRELSSLLGAQRAARSRADRKVRGWEAKEEELRKAGEVERVD